MKKQIFNLFFVLILFYSAVFTACSSVPDDKNQILKTGQSVEGFKITGIYDYMGDTKVILFTHEKTGAQVFYVDNNNTQRGFDIGFRTFAKNDKGLPHVFEHATLAGSEKYPSSNLFLQIREQTFSTYVNATTWQYMTTYPSASLSEEQLFANLDVYLNGLKDPLVMKDERAMRREAYRYVLEDSNDELTATGAVYSEMKGKSSLDYDSYYNTIQFMFPNSAQSFVTGGKPEEVLNINWDELKAFHDYYYHPSNMLAGIYGKIDYQRFLHTLDTEYLSNYAKEEIFVKDDLYEPWTGYKEAVFDYPAAANTETNNKSLLNYCIVVPYNNTYDNQIISMLLGSVINQESSWINTRLREVLPEAGLSFVFDDNQLNPVIQFSFRNVNPENKDLLKDLCDEQLDLIVQNGVEKDIFDMCELNQKFDLISQAEESDPVGTLSNFLYCWSYTGEPVSYLDKVKAYYDIENFENTTFVQDYILEKIIPAEQRGIVITRPVAGLAEKKAEEEIKFFADKKAAMSQEEIAQLIQYTSDFNKWTDNNEKINMIDKVKAVSVQDLPEEAEDITVDQSHVDRIKVLSTNIPGCDYFNTHLYFDASKIPQDKIHEFVFYTKLLGSLPTSNLSLEELENKIMVTLYDVFSGATCIIYEEGGYNPYMMISMKTLNNLSSEAWDLINDILFNTDFSDYNMIRSYASKISNNKKQQYLNDPITPALSVAEAASENKDYLYTYYNFQFDYFSYLASVALMSDSEIESLVKDFAYIQDLLLNQNGMIYTCASNKDGLHQNLKQLKVLQKKLSDEELEKQTYIFKPLPKNIAIATTSNASFNIILNKQENMNYTYSEDMYCLGNLIGDQLLVPYLRFRLGAYGAFGIFNKQYMAFASYRDPNVKETFDFYKQIPEYLNSMELTQEDLNGYISSDYSSMAMPATKQELASSAFYSIINHSYEKGKLLRLMKEAKQFNSSTIDKTLPYIQQMLDEGVKVTAANQQTINENKNMYDLVITSLIE